MIRRISFIIVIVACVLFAGFDLFHWGFHWFEEGFDLSAEVVTDCDQVKKLLRRSGVAQNAKEHSFGRIELKDPGGKIPTDAKQATWWGEFKPFRLWGKPRLKSQWLDPKKELVYEKKFQGDRCRLAKVSLPWGELPQKPTPGVWEVRILCQNQTIDSKEFLVYDPAVSQSEGGSQPQSSAYPDIVVDGKEV